MPLFPNIFSFDLIKSLKRAFCTAHPAPLLTHTVLYRTAHRHPQTLFWVFTVISPPTLSSSSRLSTELFACVSLHPQTHVTHPWYYSFVHVAKHAQHTKYHGTAPASITDTYPPTTPQIMILDKIHVISQCLQLHVPAPGTRESSYPKTLKPEPIYCQYSTMRVESDLQSEYINSSHWTLEHGAVCNIAHHTKQVDKMPQLFLK